MGRGRLGVDVDKGLGEASVGEGLGVCRAFPRKLELSEQPVVLLLITFVVL